MRSEIDLDNKQIAKVKIIAGDFYFNESWQCLRKSVAQIIDVDDDRRFSSDEIDLG